MPDPAPKHLPFAIRVAVNLNRGLEPDAGFDADDYQRVQESAERMEQAFEQASSACAEAATGLGAAATALGLALAALEAHPEMKT